jgi:GT2 family glycosyltransferase
VTASLRAASSGVRAPFASAADPVDVCALIVTYNRAVHVGALLQSLRSAAAALRLRVIVIDNGSTDDTVAMVRTVPDVVVVESGRNAGYSAAINLGRRAAGRTDALLVLNPDVVVHPGAVEALLDAARRSGVSVPRITNEDGSTYLSVRREPSVMRALGDALGVSRILPQRNRLSETVRTGAAYERPESIDWATGAVVMIDVECAARVGDWDEQFFLYSEEVDYCRRVRDTGATVVFEPRAVVTHCIGGSGTSSDLEVLMAVNRVRYFAKYHSAAATAVFRSVVGLHHALRLGRRPVHRSCLRAVLASRGRAASVDGTAS